MVGHATLSAAWWVAQLSASNALEWVYVYASRGHVPDAMVNPAGDVYRLVTDHLGSVRLVVAPDGTIRQRREYGPFGELMVDEEYDATGTLLAGCANAERLCRPAVPAIQPFGFAGGLHDRATDLVRFGARDYAPRRGRWTAKDPIQFAGGDTNLYAYVANDPVNAIDPTGLFAVTGTVAYTGMAAALSGMAWLASREFANASWAPPTIPEFGGPDPEPLGPMMAELVSSLTQHLLAKQMKDIVDIGDVSQLWHEKCDDAPEG